MGLSGWIGFLRENVLAIGRWIEEHGATTVVAGAHLRYPQAFSFHDSEAIDVSTTAAVRKGGRLVEATTRCSAAGRDVAQVRLISRPVVIEDPHSFSATPARMPQALMARFDPEEHCPEPVKREVPILVEQIEGQGELLAASSYPFTIHRWGVDFVDQWTFFEAATYVSASRENLVQSLNGDADTLIGGLALPLERFDIELRQPYYVLDDGTVRTAAYSWNDRLAFIHRLKSRVAGQDALHATAVEVMAGPEGAGKVN